MLSKRRSLLSICFLSGVKEAFFILWAPFFPEQLEKRGISDYYYAPIFTSYAVVLLISSMIAGSYMSKWGRKNAIRIGTTL